mgnify:CR=1 FL=1
MRSAEEVIAYLKKLRLIFKYLGVSDCKMQEGSLRADINLSVRETGAEEFGTRTEITSSAERISGALTISISGTPQRL